jgi:hypothetical protein
MLMVQLRTARQMRQAKGGTISSFFNTPRA